MPFGTPQEDERLREIALFARSLDFFHPTSKEPLAIEAPPPESWEALSLTPASSSRDT
jgi:hypothetical protein